MKIRPIGNKVLVARALAETTTPGGLFIPEVAREARPEFIVVACGTGKTLENGTVVPIEVAPGDRVVVGKFSGAEVELAGDKLHFVDADEILAVVGGDHR